MEENKDKGFTIKDKRFFASEDGSVREQVESQKASTETRECPDEGQQQKAEKESFPLPDITFSSFIISLSSSALFHFGEIPDPLTNKKTRNLPLAKQTVDILGILQSKTVGNLSKEESQLLENLLYDLRMRYVTETKSDKK